MDINISPGNNSANTGNEGGIKESYREHCEEKYKKDSEEEKKGKGAEKMKSMNAKRISGRNKTIGVKTGKKDDLPTVKINVKSENAFDFHIAGPRSRTEEVVHFVRKGCYVNMWFEHKRKDRNWKKGFLADKNGTDGSMKK